MPGVVTSVNVIDGFASQLSDAVGAVKDGVAGQSIAASAPCPESTGLVWSLTFSVKVQVLMLPAASVAVSVIVLEPIPFKTVPGAGL